MNIIELVKTVLEGIINLFRKPDANATPNNRDLPKRMADILDRDLKKNSFRMPDNKYIYPNSCEFIINPSDYNCLKFIIPTLQEQLASRTENRIGRAGSINQSGKFEVCIHPSTDVRQGDIETNFSSKIIVTTPSGPVIIGDGDKQILMGPDPDPEVGSCVVAGDHLNETVLAALEETIMYAPKAEEINRDLKPKKRLNLVVLKSGTANIIEGDIIPVETNKKEVLVGREPKNDVVFEYKYVGREQFRLIFDDDKTYIQNVGSKNPTALNGKELQGQTIALLNPHDKIHVADLVLAVN